MENFYKIMSMTNLVFAAIFAAVSFLFDRNYWPLVLLNICLFVYFERVASASDNYCVAKDHVFGTEQFNGCGEKAVTERDGLPLCKYHAARFDSMNEVNNG